MSAAPLSYRPWRALVPGGIGWIINALLVLLFASPAMAEEEIVLGLSKDRVAITATFNGSEILVFGAVKRDRPVPEDELGVIVTIAGPSLPVTVRRKEKRFGIWVNVDSVEVDAAPSFYAVATSGPLNKVLSATEDLRHSITIHRAIRNVGAPMTIENPQEFTEAVIRIREANGAYKLLENAVVVDEQTLFRTSISMPANLTEGAYAARIYLTRKGAIVNHFETTIMVDKVGIERWLFDLSRERALLYGLMSLVVAIAAGWGASAVFQMRGKS